MAATGDESVKVSNLKAVADGLRSEAASTPGTMVELYHATETGKDSSVNIALSQAMTKFKSLVVTLFNECSLSGNDRCATTVSIPTFLLTGGSTVYALTANTNRAVGPSLNIRRDTDTSIIVGFNSYGFVASVYGII